MRRLALFLLAALAAPALAGSESLEELMGGRFEKAAETVAGKAVAGSEGPGVAHFSSEGAFLKWDATPSWDAPVSVGGKLLQNNASDKSGPISARDFLNRAHRVHAEGKGSYADHYAHAQDNLRRKKGGAEKDNYAGMSDHETKLNEGEGAFPSYAPFFAAKKDLGFGDLNELKGAAAAIKAVSDLLSGLSTDPTNGATQWRGDELEKFESRKTQLESAKTDITVLESWDLKGVYVKDYLVLKGPARLHIFFSVTRSPSN